MRWIRPKKLPVFIAWMVIILVLGWLFMNPRFVSPYASRLVGRHLLGLEEGGLQVRDFKVRMFEGMDLFGVSLTLPGINGSMTLASADTVIVDFQVPEILQVVPRLRRVVISNPEIYSRAGIQNGSKRSTVTTDPAPFPRVEIEHLDIRDAYFEFSGADGRVVQEVSRLDWNGRVRSDQEVELTLQGCDIFWTTHNSVLEDLRGLVTIDTEKLSTTPIYGRVNGHDARVTGSRHWQGDLDISVLGSGLSVAEIEDLIDMTIGFQAAGDIAGDFIARGDTLYYTGQFSGELEGYQVSDLTGRATIGPTDVQLFDLEGILNGASFQGTGNFDISRGDSVYFVLEGDVEDVDLAKGLIPEEEDLPATDGWGRLKIEHTDLPLWTRVSGTLYDGFIDIIPFDSCLVDVDAFADEVIFNKVDLGYRDLQANLSGKSGPDRIFSGNIEATSGDLTSLPPGWEWPAMSGTLQGGGFLYGPLDNMGFNGSVRVQDHQLGPLFAAHEEASLQIADVLEEPEITAVVSGGGLSLGEVPFGSFEVSGFASALGARIESFASTHGDTSVGFALEAQFSDTLQSFEVKDYYIDLEGTSWSIAEPVPFQLGEGYFRLPGMLLESEQGAMALEANYQADRDVSGSLLLDQFDLGLLDPFIQNTRPLTGKLSADVLVAGHPDEPVVQFSGLLIGSQFDLADVDSLLVDGSFSQGAVDFDTLDLHSNFGRVQAAGSVAHPGAGIQDFWPGAELDLDLEITDGKWIFMEQFAIPALDRLEGDFNGRVQLAGTTDSPLIEGRVESSPFNVHWLHLDNLQGQVWADSDALVLANLEGNKAQLEMRGRIEIPMDLDLLSEPLTPLDQPFYMQLEIPENSDLQPLADATNAFVQSSGRGEASVVVSGPLGHPFYQGDLAIRQAGFVLKDLEEIYHDASCQGVFEGDVLSVKNIRGKEGLRGSFAGAGEVVFRGLELDSFDIRLDLDRFLLASIPDLRAVVNSRDGRIGSVFVGPDSLLVPKFTGNFELIKGRYTGDFKEKQGAVDPMAATVAPDWLADLKIHGGPRTARITNREMELYLGGDLDLIRDQAGMYLRGTLDVNAGRLIVFNNSFKVDRGRLDLSRDVGFDPILDIDATTSYRMRSEVSTNSIIENIRVHVGGTVLTPVISFTSDRGYSREAIQRMLLGLEPFATAEGDRGRLANTSISAGFNVLEREIAREIQIFDTFEIDQIQRERETGAGLDPLIGVGKYIGNDFYLKLAQGVRQDDRDILVEYQINDHLLLQSEVRRRIDENQGNQTYNLDLKYRFEY